MSIIKAVDVAFVRFSVPDLERAAQFIAEFGMQLTQRGDKHLYARGLGASPYIYSAHLGPPKFLGLAFEARSLQDLHTLADSQDAPIEDLDGPGGGKRITLTDPDGFRVEVVADRQSLGVIAPQARLGVNRGPERHRVNEVKRIGGGPSEVLRLGHVVLMVTDFRRSEQWYKERFGLISSDEVEAAPDHAIGAFMRSDRGAIPSDHHTLFLLGTGKPQFEHAAFEVPDVDDLMRGHTHLKNAQHEHSWGVGRHILGSQVFDYWKDPWGHVIEHWTDGDVMDAAWGSRKAPLEQLLGVQWGQSFHDAHPPPAEAG